MAEKRGQISLFIFFGLIILIVFGFLIYLKGLESSTKSKEETKDALILPHYTLPIKNYVQNCVEITSKDALRTIGLQGGYLNPPNYLDNLFYITSYLYHDRISYVPSKSELEAEISNYIEQNLNECVNLSVFEMQGFKFTIAEITSDVSIGNNSVYIAVSYPIKIETQNSSFVLQEFEVDMPIRLGYIIDVVEELVSNTIEEPDWININELTQFDLKINIKPRNYNTIIYLIRDEKSQLNNNESYQFIFAMDYNSSQFVSAKNTAPRLTNVRDAVVKAGWEFYYNIDAADIENDSITFSAPTPLFKINELTGEIRFTPTDFDVGEHIVPIFAQDSNKAIDYAYMHIKVWK